MEKHSPSRRTVVKGAAWAVPAVTIAAAAPALAASKPAPQIADVNVAGPGSPVNEPLVVTNDSGEAFEVAAISNVAGLPEGLQIAEPAAMSRSAGKSFYIIGTVTDKALANTTQPVTVTVTAIDATVHNMVPFNVIIGPVDQLCEGGTMSWPSAITLYQGLEVEIRDAESKVANVPLEVTPSEGAGAVQTVSVSGLPSGLTYNPTTKLVTGVTYEAGTFPVTISYTTDQNVGCAMQMALTVEPTSVTRSRITENSSMTVGQAGINGIHVTNTSDAPITDMIVRIYAYYDGDYGASTISSFDYPNITTLTSGDTALTGGPTAPWTQPRTAILERAKKGAAGAYGLNTNGVFPKGATARTWEAWFPDGSSRNSIAEQSAWNFYVRKTNLDEVREQAGDGEHIRENTVGWTYRLVPGSSIAPGETFHFQLGYAGPNAFRIALGVTVEANGVKEHINTDETGWFKHSDWNVADAEPRRAPGALS